MKYRKKPVVIEAFKWTGDWNQEEDPEWIVGLLAMNRARIYTGTQTEAPHMIIDTLEGKMRAEQGDYIIKGVKGEIYPCKPDIFELTYESADSVPPQNGSCLIAVERARQVNEEGYFSEQDDAYDRGELVDAGLSYIRAAINVGHPAMKDPPQEWPWGPQWWRPSDDRIRNLVKAGALIAAEIDRLLRLKS